MSHRWEQGRRRAFPRRTRDAILKRDPLCQLTLPGCEGTSLEADHIIGHADATAAGWTQEDIDDISNGQGVCPSCHRAKTKQEIARGRARKGRRRPDPPHPGIVPPPEA